MENSVLLSAGNAYLLDTTLSPTIAPRPQVTTFAYSGVSQQVQLQRGLADVAQLPHDEGRTKLLIRTLVHVFSAEMGLHFVQDDSGQYQLATFENRLGNDCIAAIFTASNLAEFVVQLNSAEAWNAERNNNWLSFNRHARRVPANCATLVSPLHDGSQHQPSALVLVRNTPFTTSEAALLDTANRLLQGEPTQKRPIRNPEPTAHGPLAEAIEQFIRQAKSVVQANVAFALVQHPETGQFTPIATTDADVTAMPRTLQQLRQFASQTVRRNCLNQAVNLIDQLPALMCVPVVLYGHTVAVLGMANRRRGAAFDASAKHAFDALAQMAEAMIDQFLEQRRLHRMLLRSVGGNVKRQMLAHERGDMMHSEKREVTVLYADIRRSTELVERVSAETLAEFINAFLQHMTQITEAYGGSVDKFVGDGVIALFNAPQPQTHHTRQAVLAAQQMQLAYQELAETWRQRGVEVGALGIGVGTGSCLVGEFGTETRSDYTAIGRIVNITSRMQKCALDGNILINRRAFMRVGGVVPAAPIAVTLPDFPQEPVYQVKQMTLS